MSKLVKILTPPCDDATVNIVDNNNDPLGSVIVSSGGVGTYKVTDLPELRTLVIEVVFDLGDDTTREIIINNNTSGLITQIQEFGSSGGFTTILNNVVTTAPFTLQAGDRIKFNRTDSSVEGSIRLTGTY